MSNGLLYIAGLIALALAALFAVPYFIDWNGYRGVFEEEATRILGREVRVGGDVNVRLLPSPYVSFEKLRIADPTGSTGEPFFRAESFTMRLSAPPLLKGVIEANEIVLENPFLRLAVDAEGAGNWRSFSIAAGSLPFVPAGVTLQSVKINDGTVAFYGPKGIGFAELGGLNGELKAESVEGPFAFKGSAKWEGGDREVRIATAAMDAAGAIRFKATVRGTSASNNIYVVDGRLEGIKDRPRIDGDISAKLALDPGEFPIAPVAVTAEPVMPAPAPETPSATSPSAAPQAATPSFGLPLATKTAVPMIDAKAHVVGDSKGLRLDNIALSFEHIGQPQLITGSATAAWSEKLKIDMSLSSRWLDLDRVAKGKEGAGSPLETARNFIAAMMESLPPAADSKISLDLDQASLGGEAVSDIKLEVARNKGVLLVTNLRAGLPGGANLRLDGAVADADAGHTFRGDVTLHGTSFARFLDWAAKDKALAEAVRNEGPFSLQGQLSMNERSIDLTDAGAEIGGRPITGEVHYARKDRPRLAVVLEGAEIDAGQLWPAGMSALTSMLSGGTGTDPAAAMPVLAWLDPTTTDLHMQLRAGTLVTERGRLDDVDIDVGLEQGRLAMRALKFVAADGLRVELEGDVADAGKAPKGALQGVLNAPSSEAYAGLLQLLDLSDDARRRAEALAGLAPMRLAGTVELGSAPNGGAALAVDGTVQASGRLVGTARLDGGFANWRAAPADVTLAVDGPDVAIMAAAFIGRAAARTASGAQPGEIFFKAVGVPASGMTATATAKAQGLFLGYDGRVTLPDGSHALAGDLRVSARSLSDALAVAGLGGGASLSEIPVVGALKIASADRATELKPQGLTVGGSKIDGALALAYPSEGPAIVTGQLDVDAATVPGLLALVLDRRQLAEAPGAEPLTAGKSIWPEHAFDFTALDGVEGKLSVGFGALTLADGMSVAKARAEVELAPGKVSVSKLAGKVLGGDLTTNVVLERAAGGANLTADLSIEGMQVRPTDPAAGNASEPHASLSLALSGRASTPGALVSVAAGKGELKLGDLELHAPTPLAVVATSEAVLGGEAGGSGEQLMAALQTQFETSKVKVGPRTIPIEIADGAAKLALVTIDSDAGTTKVETTVDLASLVVDSAWRVEPRAPDAPAAPPPPGQPQPARHVLPPIGVVYTGPLANAWALDQRITTDGLERELSIRKMELDADQLERLHKADAERARRDYERRKALESDEAAPAPPAPTPASPVVPDAVDGAAIAPLSPSPPVAADTGAVDPALPQAAGAAPAIPPSSASAPGVFVPPAPGQDPQETFGAAPIDPAAAVPPTADAVAPTYRRRPTQRQVQPNEQVLRSLSNN